MPSPIQLIFRITLLLSFICFSINVDASVTTSAAIKSEASIKKAEKRQDKIHKKVYKIQQKMNKAKQKAGVAAVEDAGFLEGADDRLRWGLIGVLGGILLSLILTSSLKFIGVIA